MENLKDVILKALIEHYGEFAVEVCDNVIYVDDENVDLGMCVKIEATT